MTSELQLHWRSAKALTLENALNAAFPVEDACGLVYTPQLCAVAKRSRAENSAVDEFDWSDVYEARWFDPDLELRWVRDPRSDAPVGMAVVLSEKEGRMPSDWAANQVPMPCRALEEKTYILWGTTTDRAAPPGWVECWEPRIKPIMIPWPRGNVPGNSRMGLVFVEYVMTDCEASRHARKLRADEEPGDYTREDESPFEEGFGNAFVCEERLVRFELMKNGTANTPR